jgi:hypothetical protein
MLHNKLKEEYAVLIAFMQGPDRETYARMIGFFSVPGKHLSPRELMEFKISMSYEEWVDFKVEFWSHMVTTGRVAATVV